MTNIFCDASGVPRAGWKVLAYYLLYTLLGALFVMLLSPWRENVMVVRGIAALTALLAGGLLLSAEGQPWSSVGLVLNGRWVRECLAGFLGGLLLITLAAGIVRLGNGVHFQIGTCAASRAPWVGLLFFALVALHEELAFRGYAFLRGCESLGRWPALFGFALFFAVIHWDNPHFSEAARALGFLNLALAGLLLGLARLKTGSLALPMGIHLGWNWAQGNLLGFPVSGVEIQGLLHPVVNPGKPAWLHGGSFGLEATLPCTLLCVGCIVALALWQRRRA